MFSLLLYIFLCIQLPAKNAGNSVALAGRPDLRTYRVWTFLVCSLRCGVCVCVCSVLYKGGRIFPKFHKSINNFCINICIYIYLNRPKSVYPGTMCFSHTKLYIQHFCRINFGLYQQIDMRWVFRCQGWVFFKKYRTPKSNQGFFFWYITTR